MVWLTLAGVLLATALVAWKALELPDGSWDATAIWNERARFLWLGEGRAFERAFDPANAHPDYPLLLPGAVAQGWACLGDGALVPAAFGLVTLALAVLVPALVLARRRGGDAGLAAALALLGAPALVGLAAEQLADVPLAAFVVLALGLVALAVEEPERPRARLALAGLAAGLAAWTKNEGALFLGALGLALACVRKQDGEPRRAALERARDFGLGAFPGLALLAWFKLGFAPRNDLVAGVEGGTAELATLERAKLVVGRALGELVRVDAAADPAQHRAGWGAALVGLPLVVFFLKGAGRRGPLERTGWLALALVAAGFFVVYLVTPYGLAWHLDRSLGRLVAQTLPALWLVALASLPQLTESKATRSSTTRA